MGSVVRDWSMPAAQNHGNNRDTNGGRIYNNRDTDNIELPVKDVGNLANFFFTNFPSMWNVDHFKTLFRKFGTVTDVFIARKINNAGKRFGFVKFSRVADPCSLESALNGLPVGQSKLLVNIARFDRKPVKPLPFKTPTRPRPPAKIPDAYVSPGKSFVDALNGSSPVTPITPVINMLPSNDTIKWLKCCLIGTAPSFDALANMASLRDAEGCDDITLRYLGGLDSLLEFESETLAADFLANAKETWTGWFNNLRPWHPSYVPSGRLVSILISGLPPHVWSSCAFQLVAKIFGDIICMDESTEINPNMSYGRVGIISGIQSPIHSRINVLINGTSFPVMVVEDQLGSVKLAPRFSPYFCEDDITQLDDEEEDENSIPDAEFDELHVPVVDSTPVVGENEQAEDESYHKQTLSPTGPDSNIPKNNPGRKSKAKPITHDIPATFVNPPADSIDLNRIPPSPTRSRSVSSSFVRPPRPPVYTANWISSANSSEQSHSASEIRNMMDLGSEIGFKFTDHEAMDRSTPPTPGDSPKLL